ncbi:hypothetical protein D3C76_662450 [compost metagenome]
MASNDIPMPTSTPWRAMKRVCRAMSSASTRRSRRSTNRTTPAACAEAVAPLAPMATPTLAAANAGASLMPSPTISVLMRWQPCSTARTLSSGVIPARSSSMPADSAIISAVSKRSPVSMTILSIPLLRSRRRVCGVSRRTVSEKISSPASCPSTSMKLPLHAR